MDTEIPASGKSSGLPDVRAGNEPPLLKVMATHIFSLEASLGEMLMEVRAWTKMLELLGDHRLQADGVHGELTRLRRIIAGAESLLASPVAGATPALPDIEAGQDGTYIWADRTAGKAARTVTLSDWPVVNADYAASGKLIGVEIRGITMKPLKPDA